MSCPCGNCDALLCGWASNGHFNIDRDSMPNDGGNRFVHSIVNSSPRVAISQRYRQFSDRLPEIHQTILGAYFYERITDQPGDTPQRVCFEVARDTNVRHMGAPSHSFLLTSWEDLDEFFGLIPMTISSLSTRPLQPLQPFSES